MMVRFEDCLERSGHDLVSALLSEGLTKATLTRLDQQVTENLCGCNFSRVVLILKSLDTLSENKDHLRTLLNLGLTSTVLSWSEAVHDLLTSDLQKNSAPLLSLTELFYDYLLLLTESSLPVSHLSKVLQQLVQFTLGTKIYFPLRLQAVRTINTILESLSREQRRTIQNDPQQLHTTCLLAAEVLTAGDYELQVCLAETLCRLTPKRDRVQKSKHWFSSWDISTAFCDIRDGDFEVDCRRFLNFVNNCHGDQRRVFTFPCQRAFLDDTELLRPKDENLEEFWIDFNLGSGCVSFFIDEPQAFLWGSVHLLKDEVDNYSVELRHDGSSGPETVFIVRLRNPIMHQDSQGQTVELKFSCEHHRDLEKAAGRILTRETIPRPMTDTDGSAQATSPAGKQGFRTYIRKKPRKKSKLKVLPMSSPSSQDEPVLQKVMGALTAELLFDQMRTSTPSFCSGVPVGEVLQLSQDQLEDCGGSTGSFKKDTLLSSRKRESGYFTDQTDEQPSPKKRAEPQMERAEPRSEKAGPQSQWVWHNSPQESSLVGAEPAEDEEELFDEEEGPNKERAGPVRESAVGPTTLLTSGITAAFNTFTTHLEQHFTGCWQDVETQVLQSLGDCQQHVSSLTAVHQHRLLLLQELDSGVTDHLKRLQENSENLNNINTQTLSFLQTEMERLRSFCHEHLQKLK